MYNIKGKNLISRSGSSLVMILWLFVLLVIITSVLARSTRLDTRIAATGGDRLRCKWACRAGMETAIGILNDDEPEYDSSEDLWSDNPDDLQDIELDGCTFTVKVIDESGKLNINVANKKMLMYLPDMKEEIANAILDWRDSNDDPREGSVESGYYLNLPHPYQIKNKRFSTIRELLRVRGVTEELFYGTENQEEFDATSDENILQNQGWINYLTCYSQQANKDPEGKTRLNINTASENKLQRDLDISTSHAKWIVEKRGKGFKSLGDLVAIASENATGDSSNDSNKSKPMDLKTVLGLIEKIAINNKKTIHGRININTASKVVLMALFSGNEKVVDEIIAYRKSQFNGFETYDQLAEIASLKKNILKNSIDLITIRSGIYNITTTATANLTDTVVKTQAVVDREISPVQIVYFCQGAKH